MFLKMRLTHKSLKSHYFHRALIHFLNKLFIVFTEYLLLRWPAGYWANGCLFKSRFFTAKLQAIS